MDAMLRDRLTMIAALGAGVVVGISGIYMYYKLNRTVSQELNQLSGTIENLKREIEELKKSNVSTTSSSRSSKNRMLERSSRGKSSVEGRISKTVASNVEALSNGTINQNNESSAEDNDEFFDFTDSDDAGSESWATVPRQESLLSNASSNKSIISTSTLIEELDDLLDGSGEDKQKAYILLQDRASEFESQSDYLWRLAKACHFSKLAAQKDGNEIRKKELSFEAYKAATKALEITKENPEVHKWYAITLGALGEYVSVQERVKNGHSFKEHVEIAVQLKPFDPTLHHLLGRWCYEVTILSWLERKVATMLFSEPPTATMEEARAHLIEADRLLPNWKENILLLAKCYINDGEYASAILWINKAVLLPSKAEDDEIAHAELETLQLKYRSYLQS